MARKPSKEGRLFAKLAPSGLLNAGRSSEMVPALPRVLNTNEIYYRLIAGI